MTSDDKPQREVVKINNINDFVLPSANCVKIPSNPQPSTQTTGVVALRTRKKERITLEKKEIKPVKINLSDCLACNACVTNSEDLF
uniref:4Fe-4S ferredoxin-type domain-containing protein n=1 Tax=Panagrolaimus sp. JU765 TaxID=591449 RepID=A0AC34QK83_9BILA